MNPFLTLFTGKEVASIRMFGKSNLMILVLLLLVGCSSSDLELVALRGALTLDAEPSNATTIAAASATIEENPNVSIVAKVAANEQEAFVQGQAAFLVTETTASEECQAGEGVDCPFCDKCKTVKTPTAAVKFVSESGEPLGVDARELFGIRPGDAVVIQGKGEVMPELDMLQVIAERIFIRSKK